MKNTPLLFLLTILLFVFSCENTPQKATDKSDKNSSTSQIENPNVPDWHKNAIIYEVNLRQYTTEGNFKSFEAHLPRLKEMGVDILWFMPLHPISKTKRKGGLGSPYAVGDYYDVNPDYGNMDDFKHMLAAIHDQGMYCIIDWVPNHTGWDNPWITEHPDWYTKGKDGNITDPINPETGESWGWTDVADLDYTNPDLRKAMIEAMSFWIKDVGIDGFRVDVAHGISPDFWKECTSALYSIEPVFLLAESEIPQYLNENYFISDYAWEMHHLFNAIAYSQGMNQEAEPEAHEVKNALDIDKMLAKKKAAYQKGYQMQFTSNHDENSWSGTEMQRYGDGHLAFAVLASTFNGIPLLYSGMESAMDKQLAFFEKDEIPWEDYKYASFYKTLFDLKHENKALWNGEHGGELIKIPTGADEDVYAFIREKEGDRVVVVINLSNEMQNANLMGDHFTGEYSNVFLGESAELSNGIEFKLNPWDYLVFSN